MQVVPHDLYKNKGTLAEAIDDPALWQRFIDAHQAITDYYEQRDFAKAIREIIQLADAANEYIAAKEPWKLAKTNENHVEVLAICTQTSICSAPL